MKPSRLPVLVLIALSSAARVRGAEVVVRPERAVIVLPAEADAVKKTAAEELRQHFKLVTGADLPLIAQGDALDGRYPFRVGLPAPNDVQPLAPEEARWAVTAEATDLYGQDQGACGTQFAVYGFLEDQLGVRWIRPGDEGIGFQPRAELRLTVGRSSWAPHLEFRKIRPDVRPGRGYPQRKEGTGEFYDDFARTEQEHDRYAADVFLWQRRMRMGQHGGLDYGHAFTGWWDKYAATHPEYFALNRWGKREPELRVDPGAKTPAFSAQDKESVKLCCANPDVARAIVAEWLKTGRRTKRINVCENDQVWGFCRCPDCLALDGRPAGAPLEQYLSGLADRYVHLANQVVREARQHDPEAGATIYAYEAFEQPPRREKLEPNIAVVIVPTSVDLAEVDRLFAGWKAAGATVVATRPNYPGYYETLALPIGAERHLFQAFQATRRHGCVGADYDSLVGHWPVHGMIDYVVARAFSEPDRPFEYWEDHYLAGYGPAAPEVKEYFAWWRTELWDQRLLPDLDKIVTRGRYHNFARGLMWSLEAYYRPEDFDRTDAILARAAARDLTPAQRDMVNQLVLANRNARLTYQAVVTRGVPKFEQSQALLEFRKQHAADLHLNWMGLYSAESRFGDMTGLRTAERLKAYPQPWTPTGLAWNFKPDPGNVGLTEKWQELPREQTRQWDLLRTDFIWEDQYDGEAFPKAELRAQLKHYDGIGWYATSQPMPAVLKGREIILYFGAVDESCQVYVNGQLAGQHLFEKAGDEATPFEIRIDPYLDWAKGHQNFTVRVEDRSGAGGIWKPVWLLSRLPPPAAAP